jgi:hypothetical protein
MNALMGLPSLWPSISLPGIVVGPGTYWTLDLDALPPVEAPLDGLLGWLLDTPLQRGSLAEDPDERAVRDASAPELATIVGDGILSPAFRRFIEDPEPRRHVRSATACYIDLGQFPVQVRGGGQLIHFLSDQQCVLHWLLFVGADGSERVVTTPRPLGFDTGEGEPIREVDASSSEASLAVCGDSFEQFLYHYWAMNELFFRVAWDKRAIDALPAELRAYADRYPRQASAHDIFAIER